MLFLRRLSGRVASFLIGLTLSMALVGSTLQLYAKTPNELAEERWERAQALLAPELPRDAIVFTHGGWSTRVAMRLLAEGMRLDRVEAAVRQYPTCALQKYLDTAPPQRPALDLEPRAVTVTPRP